ncbi:YadA-like family protein [uncultured Psychrobacter sp.]|uniref:YadA-like family protein n=1 Tax=uncultured Psychrobacter sp. TaxID=259303 RepID=UPI0032B2CF0B|tara:strand:+ start:705 stop:4739 length:4035 start_codon:yes stop_codon:yes gene_type:complete
MNRIYKVIWNEALSCFTAVGEYAKGRGKSSKSSVSSNATINTTSNASSINRLRLSAIGIGLIAAGFTMSPQVFAATGVGGGVEIGTASNCSTAASAGKTDSVAVGCNSVADLSSDPAVTFYQRNNPDNTGVDTSTAFNSTAIGTGAVATEAGTSLGMNASSSNLGIALGIQSKSENVAAIAIGPAALATGNTSLALGRQSAATEDFAQAIGNVSSATGKGSLAMGHSARAEGYRSIAIGSADINGADATGTQSGVVYQTNEQTLAKGKDSMAFGSGAQSLLEDSVALGSNSTANVGGNVGGYVPTGVNGTAILATKSTTGAVSVGRAASGNEAAVRRQIVNLAAGTNDSDAVNVAQLKGGISSVIDLGLDFTGDNTATTVTRNLGEKLTVKGGATTALSDNNIGVVADDTSKTLTVKLAENLIGLDSVTTGNTVMSNAGVSFLGGSTVRLSSMGLDNGSNQITNVASGVGNDFNAANIGDVNRASAAAKTEVAAGTNVAGVEKSTGQNDQDVYTVNVDGVTASAGSSAVTVTASDKDELTNITDYAVDLSADSKASLVNADNALQTVVTQIDGNEVKTLDKIDNTANFLTGDNIVLSAEDGGIKVSTAEDVTFTSVTAGDTLLNTGGVSFLGGSTVRLSSMGLDNGGNRITEVADGEDDTDAVNVRQLNATNSTVDLGLEFTGDDTAVVVNRKLGQTLTIQGGATELTENNIGVVADEEGNLNVRLAEDVMLGKNGSVRMESTVLNNAGVTITDGPNQTITLSNEGLDNGNNRIIKVGEGIAPTDAVNFAQLTTTNNEIAKGIKIGDGNSDNDQQFALGDTINITGDSNLTTTASATGVQVTLNSQLDLGDAGRLQIGNSIMNSTGFTFVDNGMGRTVRLSSTGLDNGGNTIRNVGRGELNSDAVNVGQLREVTIALDRGWDITVQGDVATQVRQGDAIDLNSRDGNIKVSRTLVNNGAALDANTGLAAVPASANDISFDLNPDITLNSVTTGGTVMNDDGLTIAGGPSITKSGIDAADTKITNVQNGEVSATSQDAINGGQLYAQGTGISSIIGGDTVYNAEDGTFTNSDIGGTGESNIDGAIASIRQGTIEISENVQINTESITTNTTNIATNTTNIATNTSNITTNTTNIETNTDKLDAGLNFGADSGANINKPIGDGSVLSFTGGSNITTTADGSSIKFDLNGNISVDSVTVGTTVINSEGISMQDGPSMTSQGLYAGNQRMTGVADGVEATDAVNYSQLSALDSRLNNNMSDLGYKIDEVEDDANAGISAAMAMSAMPQAYIAGKSLIGGGVGTYNGESAVAIGFSKLSNDGRWVIKVNGTADTQGNVGGAVGAGFHFD